MTVEEFRRHAASAQQPDSAWPAAVRALWWHARGDWSKAHDVCQEDKGSDGSWVHAMLHREEGDESNAAYWYDRAGRPKASGPVEAEWIAIAEELLAMA
ncbi:MAG: hypothetical protein EA425_13520 [Puniceicoccaceae bacterium]|nr:MAG: hypothetical protein EA425_13520 [Puniceicoccaceae bacterium]